MSEFAVETHGLGKRYGSTWALEDCTLGIPVGSVTALVGPNGAGKTTLLNLAVGLSRPSEGSISVLGEDPATDGTSARARVGFVAQEHPLHGGLTIAETLRFGRKLNPTWDDDVARARLEALRLPLGKKVSKLSGGQRAQVALTLALAKRPELLLLDEPVASLDPLARREFMQSLMQAVAARGITVVLSSHIVADLERVCDHIVILSRAHTQLAAPIEEVRATHRLLVGPRTDVASLRGVVRVRHTERQSTALVRSDAHVYDGRWQVLEADLEEIVLAYLGEGVEHEVPVYEAVGA
jgi:ABC-2 type transport system ATP-binding protein